MTTSAERSRSEAEQSQVATSEVTPITHLSQEELARRWDLSTATLERWRSNGIGPAFLKLGGKVRYRQTDVLDFEQSSLRRSTAASAA